MIVINPHLTVWACNLSVHWLVGQLVCIIIQIYSKKYISAIIIIIIIIIIIEHGVVTLSI